MIQYCYIHSFIQLTFIAICDVRFMTYIEWFGSKLDGLYLHED